MSSFFERMLFVITKLINLDLATLALKMRKTKREEKKESNAQTIPKMISQPFNNKIVNTQVNFKKIDT